MKTTRIIFATFLFAVAMLPLRAQEQIEKCYKRMTYEPKVVVKSSIQMDSDPTAPVQRKSSLCEINKFYIPKPKKKGEYVKRLEDHITYIVAAIKAEATNQLCYRIAYHTAGQDVPRQFNILYGLDGQQHVTIGTSRAKNYIFACFLDKDNPSNGYRWCYALEWWWMGENLIAGNYIKIYSKIPQEKKETVQNEDAESSLTAKFFKNFNALRWRWMNKEYKSDTSLPVSIYVLVNDAVSADILTPAEKNWLEQELTQLAKIVNADATTGVDASGFIRLAHKVLEDSKDK